MSAENTHEEEGLFLAGYSGAKMAMWLFLATEILIFGGLFAAYIYWRSLEPEMFSAGAKNLSVTLGATNTVVLLVSSLSVALGLDAVQRGNPAKMRMYLYITLACAMIFMVIKTIEYTGKYEHHLFPGGEDFNKYGRYIPLYFMMTGLHGLHVLIGMGCMIGVLYFSIKKNAYTDYYYVHVENTALYWHLVDLIWIFLFPLMYLI